MVVSKLARLPLHRNQGFHVVLNYDVLDIVEEPVPRLWGLRDLAPHPSLHSLDNAFQVTYPSDCTYPLFYGHPRRLKGPARLGLRLCIRLDPPTISERIREITLAGFRKLTNCPPLILEMCFLKTFISFMLAPDFRRMSVVILLSPKEMPSAGRARSEDPPPEMRHNTRSSFVRLEQKEISLLVESTLTSDRIGCVPSSTLITLRRFSSPLSGTIIVPLQIRSPIFSSHPRPSPERLFQTLFALYISPSSLFKASLIDFFGSLPSSPSQELPKHPFSSISRKLVFIQYSQHCLW